MELSPVWKKIGLNLFDYDDFTITYILHQIPKSPESHQLPTQSKKNMWIGAINREQTITAKGELDKLHYYQTKHVNTWSISAYVKVKGAIT